MSNVSYFGGIDAAISQENGRRQRRIRRQKELYKRKMVRLQQRLRRQQDLSQQRQQRWRQLVIEHRRQQPQRDCGQPRRWLDESQRGHYARRAANNGYTAGQDHDSYLQGEGGCDTDDDGDVDDTISTLHPDSARSICTIVQQIVQQNT